jgi:MGT family glycosyltransferase
VAHVLFVSPPWAGHLYPALAIAAKLRREGHRIGWAVPWRPLVDEVLKGEEVFALPLSEDAPPVDRPSARGLESVQAFFEDFAWPMARQTFSGLVRAMDGFQPDALVVDHQMPGGALAARASGHPWVTLACSSASIHRIHPNVDAWMTAEMLKLQQELLPKRPAVERPDFSPHGVIVLSVEALMGGRRERFDAPYHFVGPTHGEGRSELPFPWEWLRPDRHKLLITLGTVNRNLGSQFFSVVCEAMSGLPEFQAVMVAPEEIAAAAPPNVLVSGHVPQIELLRRVDAVLCHAGHNTVYESLAQGLPLIVSPIRHDQPLVAEQVLAQGAGLFLRYGKATPNATRATIRRLFDEPGFGERARELAALLRAAPGAEGAAAVVQGLLNMQNGSDAAVRA